MELRSLPEPVEEERAGADWRDQPYKELPDREEGAARPHRFSLELGALPGPRFPQHHNRRVVRELGPTQRVSSRFTGDAGEPETA